MTKTERAKLRREKESGRKQRQWLSLPQLRSDQLIVLWLAHNRGIKTAYKAARGCAGYGSGYHYDGPKLFRGNALIAEQRTSKGKPSFIMLVRPVSDVRILSEIAASVKGNGPVVYVQNSALKSAGAARAMRMFSNYPFRATVSAQDLISEQKSQDKRARDIVVYYKPVAVKHREESARLNNIYLAAQGAVSDAFRGRPSADEILKILRHNHVDGMVYKRLHSVYYNGNKYQSKYGDFIWPPLGEWTPTVESPALCSRGYHLCPKDAITEWYNHGPHLFVAEGDIPGGSQPDKTVYGRARLVKYVGDISTITPEKTAAFRGTDIAALRAVAAAANKAYIDYRAKYGKYL